MPIATNVELDALLGEILLTPEGKADPYPRYAVIREHAPAYESALGFVVVGRYDECQWVLRDPRFGKGEPDRQWENHGLTEAEWAERFGDFKERSRSMLGLDPPDHTRLRRLVAKAFTPKTVETLRPGIKRLTSEVLDGFVGGFEGAAGGVVDVISELAMTLPVAVIGEMLGVPATDRAELQPLVRDAVGAIEINPTLEQLDAASDGTRGIADRFELLIEKRRGRPTDDLLSDLMHVEEQGDQLTHSELITTIILIFAAGFETTSNLIGNGLYALLEHPDQLARLRADRGLVDRAVEELLRWDSPVQLNGRTALTDLDDHGIQMKAGEQIVTLLGAANRDPRVFSEPDRLDLGRDGPAPMSFGGGIHFCLGAALARAEGQIVFGELLDRFPVIEPAWAADPPVYRDSIVLRGLETLPVRFA